MRKNKVIKKFSNEVTVHGGNPQNSNLKFFNQKILNFIDEDTNTI